MLCAYGIVRIKRFITVHLHYKEWYIEPVSDIIVFCAVSLLVVVQIIGRRGTVTETELCRDHYAALCVVEIIARRGTVTETEPNRYQYAALCVAEINSKARNSNRN